MADPLRTHLGDLVERLDHVAIAVADIATASRLPTMLGAEFAGGGDDTAKGFRWVQFRVPGSGKIEVLQPLPDAGADHFLVKFLAERGEGLHHITLKVTDLAAAIVRVEEAGYRIVGVDDVRTSWKEAFVHPGSSHGVLVQLAQWDDADQVGAATFDEALGGVPDGYEA